MFSTSQREKGGTERAGILPNRKALAGSRGVSSGVGMASGACTEAAAQKGKRLGVDRLTRGS